ncbi:hypothetical protein A6279_23810 [Bacillus wiedmannii]|nr:hypothetical protein A6278_24705 [Bacillus wiedmannii]OAK12478.1 hypothetical protein A6279_23810 [Bacillus wiedmannii]
MATINTMVKSIRYGMAGLEVLREQLDIINKSLIKNYLGCKRIFLLGIVRMRGGALHMGKGRSNNAGKKQPNFDDSSNFAKQSQPTEKKKK